MRTLFPEHLHWLEAFDGAELMLNLPPEKVVRDLVELALIRRTPDGTYTLTNDGQRVRKRSEAQKASVG